MKNYYFFQHKNSPERPLIVPLEALQPCEEYHTYHLERSVKNRDFSNRIQYNNERKAADLKKELRKTVKALITEISVNETADLIVYFLSKDEYFIKEYKHYRDRTNHPQQTEKL